MSKTIKFMLIAVLAVLLASCGSSKVGELASGASASPGDSGQDATSNSPYGLTEQQLVFGSLRLEQGEHAIDAAQAGELLPLWQAYQSLLQSDTAAQAEISALLTQIEAEMTGEQLAAIAGMEFDPESITGLMAELGLQVDPGDGAADGTRFDGEGLSQGFPEGFTPGQGPGGGQGPGAGQFPGGGEGPGAGQFPGGGEGLSPEQIATFQAENPDLGNRAGRGNTALIRPLIVLLESKLG